MTTHYPSVNSQNKNVTVKPKHSALSRLPDQLWSETPQPLAVKAETELLHRLSPPDQGTTVQPELQAWANGWLECLECLHRLEPTALKRVQTKLKQRFQTAGFLKTGLHVLSNASQPPVHPSPTSVTDSASITSGSAPQPLVDPQWFHEIITPLHQSLDEAEIHQAIVQQLCHALEGDYAGLILYNQAAQTLAVVATHYQGDTAGASVPPKEAPIGLTLRLASDSETPQCWTQHSPWVAQDIDTAVLPEVERLLLQASGVHSTLIVPIVDQGNLLGSAYISQHSSCRLWNTTEMKMAEMVAQHAAIALRHARHYQEATQQARREQALNRIAHRIRTSLDLDISINTALEELLHLTKTDLMLFCMPETADSETLKITHQAYPTRVTGSRMPAGERFLEIGTTLEWTITRQSLSESLRGQVITVISNTQHSELDEKQRATFQQQQIGALLDAPIWYQDTLLGHLWAIRQEPYHWREDEIIAVEAVANQLAIALTQAQLYNCTQQQATDAQAWGQQLAKALAEKNQLIQSLHATQAQLIQQEKMSSLGQLVAGIAHEINNPINFIYGNIPYITNYTHDILELIHRYQTQVENKPVEIAQFESEIDLAFMHADLIKILQSMQHGAERVREIVITLRNFARLDEAEKKQANIHEGLESTLILLNNRLYGIEVIRNYGQIPAIECYPGQLNQVFMNILGNAIDAIQEINAAQPASDPTSTPALGQIVISTALTTRSESSTSGILPADLPAGCPDVPAERLYEPLTQKLQIRIRDTGAGMTPDTCGKIFDPFFTTKPVGAGTGLGLSIAYKIIVQKHQGKLWCESTPGQSTEFVIELPCSLPS
jgi:two-component system NtrC family sensor kinase